MQRAIPILVVVIALSMAGCVLRGKPKVIAPAAVNPVPTPPVSAPAPPPPLSTPQTNVQLPAPQPVTPDALATTQPPEEGPPPAPAPQRPATPKRAPVLAVKPPPEPAALPAAPPVEAGRALVRDVLPAEEQKRLGDEAATFRKDIGTLVAQVKRPNGRQKASIDRINVFLKQSEEAESGGDLRKANELAGRALVLAKDLQ